MASLASMRRRALPRQPCGRPLPGSGHHEGTVTQWVMVGAYRGCVDMVFDKGRLEGAWYASYSEGRLGRLVALRGSVVVVVVFTFGLGASDASDE